MEAETIISSTDSMDFKIKELLKEVHLDQTAIITKLVDDTVSAIKKVIRKIPDDLQVCFLLSSLVSTEAFTMSN